jgi:replicative superfamily II helicase
MDLKKSTETTNTQKQLNELREYFNKLQNETKEIIKKEIYEIKKTAQDMNRSLAEMWKVSKKRIKEESWK